MFFPFPFPAVRQNITQTQSIFNVGGTVNATQNAQNVNFGW